MPGAWWVGREGSLCAMGTEFQAGKMKKFWRYMAMDAQQYEYT